MNCVAIAEVDDDTTLDGFLGGRLKLRQPKSGHRAGHDALLLAASTSAKAGQRIVDLGAGIGAAGLALASRVEGIDLVLVEIDPSLAALAETNAKSNGLRANVVVADVTSSLAELAHQNCDGVMMNPPFHDAARHRASPDEAKRMAHTADDDTLATWIAAAHRLLTSRGVLTLIWRADGLAAVLACLGSRFGSVEVQPVHGARDKPAIRVLVRAIKGGRAPLTLHRGALLDGRDSDVESAIRGESGLPLARGNELGRKLTAERYHAARAAKT